MGAWHPCGSDGLTCGGSAGVLLPLGELSLTPVGHVGLNPKPSENDKADWQHKFDAPYLLTCDDLAQGVIDKVGDPREYYNFSNWSLTWFSQISEIQSSKHGDMKLKISSWT